MSETVLFGPVSLDRYLDEVSADGGGVLVLPGGGALNMAYHWSRLGLPFHFLTRIGDDEPRLFLDFLDRHGIAYSAGSITGVGRSAAIDITMGADRQPWMDNFVEGVWAGFSLTDEEDTVVAGASHLHAVLVDAVVDEVHRLGDAGALDHLAASGDFLSFRHYDLDRFARTMSHLDIGFIGWPGDVDDPVLDGIRRLAHDLGRLVIVTLGSRGVRVIDGRDGAAVDRWVPVDAVEVLGTTVGCGDAFIAAVLADLWSGRSLDTAIDSGRAAGAAATAWMRPLPDAAFS